MEGPMIQWSKGAHPTKCTKIVVTATKEEIETVNKSISQTMNRLKRLGYCKNGYEIIMYSKGFEAEVEEQNEGK